MTTKLRETVCGTPSAPGTTRCIILLTDCERLGTAIKAVESVYVWEGMRRLARTRRLDRAATFRSPAEAGEFLRKLPDGALAGWSPTIVPL